MKARIRSITLDQVNKNVLGIKRELNYIKELLQESELELTVETKKALEEARKTSKSKYISHEDLKKQLLK